MLTSGWQDCERPKGDKFAGHLRRVRLRRRHQLHRSGSPTSGNNTGGPRYSRGLRSGKVQRISKPRIAREQCYGQKVIVCSYLYENPWIIKGKSAGYKNESSKTANNKPANSEGRQYALT
jgi:hypothetical protein